MVKRFVGMWLLLTLLAACAVSTPAGTAPGPGAAATDPLAPGTALPGPATAAPVPASEGTARATPPCVEAGARWTSPHDGMALRCVPEGTFIMGAPEDDPAADADEKPAHEVWLDAFWIDETEVTNAQFARCVAAGACRRQVEANHSQTRPSYYDNPAYADYPVLIYDAEDAGAYCRWAGRRLPTEAEWEKAARGTDARAYPWGEELDCTRASHAGCDADTLPVGSRLAGASAYGALDMAGSVWEWVADRYDAGYYAHSPGRNPEGPEEGKQYVVRGGGWKSFPVHLRTTHRAGGISHWFDGQIGFRCALGALDHASGLPTGKDNEQ